MKKETKVEIVQDPEAPIEKNILAQAIMEISSAMRKLEAGGLTREAIIVLTHEGTRPVSGKKPSRSEVRAVIDSLTRLRNQFCR